MQITIEAPAKINLRLKVCGRRPDGYHLLEMIMVPLIFGDTLAVSAEVPASVSSDWYSEDGIRLQCEAGGVPLDGHHLCVRAARAMRTAARRDDPITMRLIKRIPIAAGLGGGSSDAAAVLRALNDLWELRWSPDRLAEIGVQLGADVPFFCWGTSAVVRGIGEQVIPIQKIPNMPILLVNPNLPISTPEVYRRYDERNHGLKDFHLTGQSPDASDPPIFERFEDVTACLANDLEPITAQMVPELLRIRERLRVAGADAVLMSGSGPTMFAMFRTRGARDAALVQLKNCGWWLCGTEILGA